VPLYLPSLSTTYALCCGTTTAVLATTMMTSISDKPLKAGERAKVMRIEGLMLFVHPEGN
jgi:hypothetical protein